MDTIKLCCICPYCGKSTWADLGINVWGTVIMCDSDESGCEQKYVAILTTGAKILKLEGYGHVKAETSAI